MESCYFGEGDCIDVDIFYLEPKSLVIEDRFKPEDTTFSDITGELLSNSKGFRNRVSRICEGKESTGYYVNELISSYGPEYENRLIYLEVFLYKFLGDCKESDFKEAVDSLTWDFRYIMSFCLGPNKGITYYVNVLTYFVERLPIFKYFSGINEFKQRCPRLKNFVRTITLGKLLRITGAKTGPYVTGYCWDGEEATEKIKRDFETLTYRDAVEIVKLSTFNALEDRNNNVSALSELVTYNHRLLCKKLLVRKNSLTILELKRGSFIENRWFEGEILDADVPVFSSEKLEDIGKTIWKGKPSLSSFVATYLYIHTPNEPSGNSKFIYSRFKMTRPKSS